nr:VanZ family protein [Streptomyces sabulosicollis]
MISIAGWEIRRTAEKRTTVKRTAEKKPRAGSQKQAGGRKKGPRTGGDLAEGSPAKGSPTAKKPGAKPPTTKGRAEKAGPTKTPKTRTPTTRTPTTKTPTTKTATTKGRFTKARPGKGRTTTGPEPQGAPEKALLQRSSFGARLARATVLLLAFVCMVGFAAALAKATLVPSPGSVDLVHTNLHPGRSLRTYVDQPAFRDTVKQIGGNVLLGAPFGVLLPMLVPKARGAARVVVVTALVMVAVETVQGLIVEGRAFDIDDVILNTSGALLGYVVVGRRLGRALHPRRRHWWHRWTRRGTEAPPAA